MTVSRSPIVGRRATCRTRGRVALPVLAGAYLIAVWLDGSGSGILASILPRTADYFVQVSALFPWAATASIDYRAELLSRKQDNDTTMTALDSYLLDNHNSTARRWNSARPRHRWREALELAHPHSVARRSPGACVASASFVLSRPIPKNSARLSTARPDPSLPNVAGGISRARTDALAARSRLGMARRADAGLAHRDREDLCPSRDPGPHARADRPCRPMDWRRRLSRARSRTRLAPAALPPGAALVGRLGNGSRSRDCRPPRGNARPRSAGKGIRAACASRSRRR
jgi:hypothetical protein